MCVMCDVVCAGHVWVGCMPSGQSEEYHIVTVQSDQARVGFSSSGSIFGSGVAVACRWVGGRVGGAAEAADLESGGTAREHEHDEDEHRKSVKGVGGKGEGGKGVDGEGVDRCGR